jgi:outer membrane biosynthesis protein TonB
VNKQRRKGTLYSGVFHFLLLVLAIFGLPSILNLTPPPEPIAISVDILPVSEMSNVKPHEVQPEPPKKPVETLKETTKKPPSPPVKTAKDTPPPPPTQKVAKTDKPKPKPPEKKPEPKPKEDDLDAILKAVKDTAQEKKDKEQKANEKAESPAKSERYDDTMPLSLSEKDAIRNQIAKCWNVPAGAKDAQDLVVTLRLQLEPTGTVLSVELASSNQARYSTDTFFRAAADSAMRAVRQCSPLKDLDPEKYGTWKDMELTFNPKDMLL